MNCLQRLSFFSIDRFFLVKNDLMSYFYSLKNHPISLLSHWMEKQNHL